MQQPTSHLSTYERQTMRYNRPDSARRDFARGEERREPTRRPGGPRKFVAKGHDAQLQEAQNANLQVAVMFMSGEVMKGLITRRDKFTITLDTGNGVSHVLYKHAIESISIPQQAPKADTAAVEE